MTNIHHQERDEIRTGWKRIFTTLAAATFGAIVVATPTSADREHRFPRGSDEADKVAAESEAKCIRFRPTMIEEGPVTTVGVVVQDGCGKSAQLDARVDLVVHVVGGRHAFVADSARFDRQGNAFVSATISNGVVAQEACTRIEGWWIDPDGTRTGPVNDFRCF